MNDLVDDRMLSGINDARRSARYEPSLDLGQLADQLATIAAQMRGEDSIELHVLSQNAASTGANLMPSSSTPRAETRRPTAAIVDDPQQKRALFAQYAREAYAIRRRRGSIFDNPELFGEPAWDILLDLYIAHADQKPVSVSSACIGSAAPPTTGLRWLGVLAEQDLILREHDPQDQRRVLVRLTERGLQAMDKYFESATLSV